MLIIASSSSHAPSEGAWVRFTREATTPLK